MVRGQSLQRMNSRTTEPMQPSAPDVIEQPVASPVVACSELLDGWTIETKWVGIGTCGAGRNKVLCRGNWGVIGGTGHFNILFPSGWVEDTPRFATEIEAMMWIINKTKPSNA